MIILSMQFDNQGAAKVTIYGWAKNRLFLKIYTLHDDTEKEFRIKMFSSLSGIGVVFCMSPFFAEVSETIPHEKNTGHRTPKITNLRIVACPCIL